MLKNKQLGVERDVFFLLTYLSTLSLVFQLRWHSAAYLYFSWLSKNHDANTDIVCRNYLFILKKKQEYSIITNRIKNHAFKAMKII